MECTFLTKDEVNELINNICLNYLFVHLYELELFSLSEFVYCIGNSCSVLCFLCLYLN